MDSESDRGVKGRQVSTFDEVIAQARAELADLEGPARAAPLSRLGSALAQKFMRDGPAAPTGLSDLGGAIDAITEAHQWLPEDDASRSYLSFLAGLLVNWRFTLLCEERDRVIAVTRFEEGLASPILPKMAVPIGKVMLGFLYVMKALMALQDPAVLASRFVHGGAAAIDDSDIERGVVLLREVTTGPSMNDDIAQAAAVALELSEALKTMLGTGASRVNLSNMMAGIGRIQALQEKLSTQMRPGYGMNWLGDLFDFSDPGGIARAVQKDRPVSVVVQTDMVIEPEVVPQRRIEIAAEQPTAAGLRADLHAAVPPTLPGVPVWENAAALLALGEDELPADVVDDLVAMASQLVELDGSEPANAAVDGFLLAVALRLRGTLADDPVDLREALDMLLTAARTVPPDHAAASTIMSTLGAFLDPERPLGGLEGDVAAGFAGRIDAVLALHLTDGDPLTREGLHLLRCLCRAAWSMAELARAVDAAPAEIPWLPAVRAGHRSE